MPSGATYSISTRKLGDGYCYYKEFSGDSEATADAVISDDTTFGGTDPVGSEFAIERELFEDVISQEPAPIARTVVSEKGTFKVTMSVGHRENLAISLGLSTSDVGSYDVGGNIAAAHEVLIGGEVNLQKFSLVLKVANSFSPSLYDYLYLPNTQVDPSATIKWVRDEIRKAEVTFNALASTQAALVASGGRHALGAFYYEKAS